jgi:glycosyltransferase involved in cell wall biosynthesis
MRSEERRWAERVTLNVTVSEVDRAALSKLSPNAKVAVVPNGVDTNYFTASTTAAHQHGLIFVGGSSWFPNADAIAWFCDEILPHLRKLDINVPITWVGRASADEQRAFTQRYGIEVTGYVDDVRPYLRAAACYIVPIRVGGGTRIKILDAWAMGKATVSTAVGCEGLHAVDGENILIRDSPEQFALAVATVLRNAEVRMRLERAARATAEARYSWSAIGRDMVRLYYDVANPYADLRNSDSTCDEYVIDQDVI